MRTKNRARSFMHVRSSRSNSRSRSKRGVSPVIGVILMVAATIVIAGVVMGMLGGFSPPRQNYVVTATATSNAAGTSIAVTYQGGPDADLVSAVHASNGTTTVNLSNVVGNSTTFTGTPGTGNDHIVVNASFRDGSNQVILDTWV